MIDFIIGFIIFLIFAGASLYIYKAKKKGNKCIGCPYSKECSGSCQKD